MKEILYLVIPCYNEQEVLPEASKQLKEKMLSLISSEKVSPDSKIVFVNDGSKDKTWEMICELHEADPIFSGVCLSRNRGHQNALLGGLMTVKDHADMVISLDADLQDDIDAIDEMVDKYYEGNDVVYGVRSSRKTDSFFKRGTAQGFYKMLKWMGVDTVYNHADYRLLSKRALNALEDFAEVNIFLRGMVPMLGFRSDVVYYERKERFAGESKYPLKKMLGFAFEGVSSLSIRPMRFILMIGIITFIASIGFSVYFLIRYFSGMTVEGWVTTVMSIWLLGGLQLIAIGIIGQYIGKIYLESKARPRYIISEFLNN